MTNKFFGAQIDDKFSYTEKYKRDDIYLIPSCYSTKWSRDLNKLLGKVFVNPVKHIEDTYLPAKSNQHLLLAKALKEIREREIKKVFLVNALEDFTTDYYKAGFASDVYGIVHGSDWLKFNPGSMPKLKPHEKLVAEISTKLFTATNWFAKNLPYETTVIGLPILDDLLEPRESEIILFDHRVTSEKNPMKLLDFPPDLKKRILISTPFVPQSSYVPKLIKEFGDRFVRSPSEEKYMDIRRQAGFGISLSNFDTFGYAVVGGIISGLCYFVPDNEYTAYKDFMIDELIYKDENDLYEKIRYYTKNYNEKVKVIKKQQSKLTSYFPENWLKNLLAEIE